MYDRTYDDMVKEIFHELDALQYIHPQLLILKRKGGLMLKNNNICCVPSVLISRLVNMHAAEED
jgi:hypothetical protein